jgi:hypothetical protein
MTTDTLAAQRDRAVSRYNAAVTRHIVEGSEDTRRAVALCRGDVLHVLAVKEQRETIAASRGKGR